jgi:eukaryotic-like serine/threonine-protein kinase
MRLAIRKFVTAAYNFERDLLERCKGEKLTRVVLALGHGAIDAPTEPLKKIFYLIFELADGNVRDRIAKADCDAIWYMNVLRHTAAACSSYTSERSITRT